MKVVQNKNEAKKRKRDDCQSAITESPKKAKVHAQRKFAQGAAYNSPSITVIKDKVRPPANISNPGLVLSAKRPNTEDFLTFLCFRRTSILPPKLYFFNDAYKVQPGSTNCVQKTPNSSPAVKNHVSESASKTSSKRSDKNEVTKKPQTPVQVLRRKYQEQRLAKQNPTNVTKLAQKVKGKNMIRTRSSTLQEEKPKQSKEVMLLSEGKAPLSGLRSGLQRSPPANSKYLKKNKNIAEMKNLRSRIKGKVITRKVNLKQLPERKVVKNPPREAPPKKNEVAKNNKSPEASSGKSKDVKVNVKKAEGLSDFSSDDNEPLLAVRKGKPIVKGKKLANGIKEVVRTNCVKTRSQISEILSAVSHTSMRPTRKTKEAAALYMEMITKKLVSPEKSGDDDRSSVDSFPELPNARRNEQRESEIRAKAMALKKGRAKENSVNANSQVKERSVRSSNIANRKRELERKNCSVPPSGEAAKKAVKENHSRKVKEEPSKRAVREPTKNTAKAVISKKPAKEDPGKKESKEEPPRKIFKGEIRLRSTREELARKPVKHVKTKSREDSTRKEDPAKKVINDNLSKKTIKEEVSKKTTREETTKKAVSDHLSKKIEKEDPPKKNLRDELSRKVTQDDMGKKTAREEPPKKHLKEDIMKKTQQNVLSEDLTKKTVKEDPQKKPLKEETARKQQEDGNKKLAKDELVKKNVKDETAKKGSSEDLSKKVLRDEVNKKIPSQENLKKSGKESGKDETVKNVMKEEITKKLPQEENVTKVIVKEEILKKAPKEDVLKKVAHENASNKAMRDEVPKKMVRETVIKELNEHLMTITKEGSNIMREEVHKRGPQEDLIRKSGLEEIGKKAVKDSDLPKKALHEDAVSKTVKDDISKEEPLKKSMQEEPPKKELKDDFLKKIVQDCLPKKPETTKEELLTLVQKEEPKKMSEDQMKRGTREDVKKPVWEDPKLKVVKEEIPKEVNREEPKNKIFIPEVPKTGVIAKGQAKEEPTKKIQKEEGTERKNEPLKEDVKVVREECLKKQADELKMTNEGEKYGDGVDNQKVEQIGNVEGRDENDKQEETKKMVKNPTKDDVPKLDEAEGAEENEFRPSTRGRKQEAEPEGKTKKPPERTSGVKKPNTQPKKGCTSASITPGSSWVPPPGPGSNLVEAPTFYPTEKEFQDPLEFFERIRPAAESFGLCRIVPPGTFKPDCKVSDDMRFTAYNQYVHRMYHRWGPNIKEMMAIKKYLATQSISLKQPPWIGGIEVDLPRLYQSVQNCGGLMKVMEKKKWNQVADMMRIPKAAQDRVTKLDDIYCKYLLPYDTLSHEERQKLFDEVESDWLKRQESTSDPTDEESEEELYIDECEECIVKGRNMALNQFYRIARNTMSMWFKNPEPSPSEVENEFWRHVSERTNHVCVHSGSIDSSGWGYGFPVAKNNSFSRHPWNLKVLTNNSGSVLRSLGPVMGVTVPTLHVGMVFTAFCWYRDPHGLPWVEYLHTGAPKIWYGISDDNSAVFKDALTKLLPRYIKNKKIWLPSDTAMVPPALLVEQGVSLCHTIQKPGQFILVFPRAFTSSICTGYLVSESVYFAQPSWLTTAEQVFKDIQDCCEPTMFSLEKLLFSIATDSRSSVEVLKQVLPMVWHIKQNEIDGRKTLCNLGLKVSERLPIRDQGGSKKRKGRWAQDGEGDYECEVCRTNLNVSLVINSQEEGVLCLPHAIELLTQKRHHLKYCKLMYSYTQEELCELVEKLEQRIESKSQKKVQNKSTVIGK